MDECFSVLLFENRPRRFVLEKCLPDIWREPAVQTLADMEK